MKAMPIRYVRDAAASRRFYETLGLEVEVTNRPGSWVELRGEGTVLALHQGGQGTELTFASGEPLEAVAERLRAAGYDPDPVIVDEAFGRTVTVRDPDGHKVCVAEHDRELYT